MSSGQLMGWLMLWPNKGCTDFLLFMLFQCNAFLFSLVKCFNTDMANHSLGWLRLCVVIILFIYFLLHISLVIDKKEGFN